MLTSLGRSLENLIQLNLSLATETRSVWLVEVWQEVGGADGGAFTEVDLRSWPKETIPIKTPRETGIPAAPPLIPPPHTYE